MGGGGRKLNLTLGLNEVRKEQTVKSLKCYSPFASFFVH